MILPQRVSEVRDVTTRVLSGVRIRISPHKDVAQIYVSDADEAQILRIEVDLESPIIKVWTLTRQHYKVHETDGVLDLASRLPRIWVRAVREVYRDFPPEESLKRALRSFDF